MADATGTGGSGGPWAAPASPRPVVHSPSRTAGSDDLRTLLDADHTGVVILGPDGAVENLNAAMLTLLGVDSIEQVRAGGPGHAAVTAFLDQLPRQLRTASGGSWRGALDHPTAGGGTRTLRVTAHATPASGGGSSISLLLHDVSDERRALHDLRHRATHDHLTGLAHRDLFMFDLANALGAHDRNHRVAAVSIDLDHLRRVNDALGPDAGDQLLAATARRLELLTGPGDRVARVGGDEFLVMYVDIVDGDEALHIAERAERALRGTVSIDDRSVEFGASVGVAVDASAAHEPRRHDDDDGIDAGAAGAAQAATLVAAADAAMREAKRRGGARAVLHDGGASTTSFDRGDFVTSLSRAISDHGLTVEYQPVFSTTSKRAVGAEALARWHHPTRGPIDPATFITVAEESGLIGRLGAEVLDLAIGDLRRWIDRGVVDHGFAIHVNVSSAQLASVRFVDSVLDALERHRCVPSQLVLEARETSLASRSADVDRSIQSLRRHGVNMAVDDFGTGVQALGIMTGIGADVVKLDGSLALPAGSSDAQTRLVRAVVLFAHALDMGVVAERVSGVDQLRRLEAVGCDMVQGNLLGEPCRADEFVLTSTVSW